jgi:hypothetical protein
MRSEGKTDKQDRPYYVVQASQGRETDHEERAAAVLMHQEIRQNLGQLQLAGDSDEAAEARRGKRERASKSDGLDVA